MTTLNNCHTAPAVLLVDDDPDIRMVVRDVLEMGGYSLSICEVETGEEALNFLYRRGPYADAPRPAMIYMDIEMPGMGGQAAVAEIRQDPAMADIPIVMMSGLNTNEQKLLAASNGANSYTFKPNDPTKLAESVLRTTDYWAGVHLRPEPEICNE